MFLKISSLGGDPHNFITIKTLASIIGDNIVSDTNLINYRLGRINPKTDDTDLDYCHPFPGKGEKTGPKFIVFNEKCEAFIREFEK